MLFLRKAVFNKILTLGAGYVVSNIGVLSVKNFEVILTNADKVFHSRYLRQKLKG